MASQQQLDIVVKLQDEASEKMKKMGDNIKVVGAQFAVVGGAITAALGYTVVKAAEAQVKMANFDATLKAAGDSTEETRRQLLDAADATTQLGFDNETAAQSLAKFFQRTKDVKQSIELNNTAMDLARAKNIDLSTATNLVNMALSGSGKALLAYGINIKEASSPLEALGELHKAVGGQADAFSKTLTGSTQALNESFGDLAEEIGTALIPMITSLIQTVLPIIHSITAWVKEHPKLTEAIVITTGVLGILLTGIGALLLILPAVTAGMAAFSAVFTASLGPIGLVIAAIAAVVVWLVWLYHNVDVVKANWIAAWTILKENILALTTAMRDGIMAVWNGIGQFFVDIWEGIKNTFKAAFDWIMNNVINPITNAVANVWSAVTGIAQKVGNGISSAGGVLKENANAAAGAVGRMLGFADGGVVPGATGEPMVALVHGGETITPPGKSSGGINVYITGNTISNQLDLDSISRQIVNTLRLNLKLSV